MCIRDSIYVLHYVWCNRCGAVYAVQLMLYHLRVAQSYAVQSARCGLCGADDGAASAAQADARARTAGGDEGGDGAATAT
eukprot:2675497-Pyramimonas_sp.AAC.1